MSMNLPENDRGLSEELRRWTVTTPLPPRFREGVWQRIASAETEAERGPWAEWVARLAKALVRPKVAYAYLGALVAVGMTAGAWTAQLQRERLETDLGQRYVQALDPFQLAASHK